MIAELGHYALMLAFGLALIQATMPIVGTRTDDPTLISVAAPAALAQFFFVALSDGSNAKRLFERGTNSDRITTPRMISSCRPRLLPDPPS